MFIKESQEMTNEVEVVTDVICDSCGRSMVQSKETPDWIEGLEADLIFGYGSKRDSEAYVIHLCDECFDKMVELMEIKLVNIHDM